MRGQALLLALLTQPLLAQFDNGAQMPMPAPTQKPFLVEKRVAGVGSDFADNPYHVIFRLPLKWKVVSQMHYQDTREDAAAATIMTHDSESKLDVGIYYRADDLQTRGVELADIDQELLKEISKKV